MLGGHTAKGRLLAGGSLQLAATDLCSLLGTPESGACSPPPSPDFALSSRLRSLHTLAIPALSLLPPPPHHQSQESLR